MSSINNSELSDFTFGQNFQDAAHENNIINNLNSLSPSSKWAASSSKSQSSKPA